MNQDIPMSDDGPGAQREAVLEYNLSLVVALMFSTLTFAATHPKMLA
jgi:hypothetical protein